MSEAQALEKEEPAGCTTLEKSRRLRMQKRPPHLAQRKPRWSVIVARRGNKEKQWRHPPGQKPGEDDGKEGVT